MVSKQRKKLLLVDGYNVLRSGSRYREITGPDYTDDAVNTARERLVNDVVNYAGRDWRAKRGRKAKHDNRRDDRRDRRDDRRDLRRDDRRDDRRDRRPDPRRDDRRDRRDDRRDDRR